LKGARGKLFQKKVSPAPFKMHTVQTVFINALDSEGRGVGRLDGPVVFVPGALPGERAEIRIAARKKNYAEGELVRVLEASPDRIAPPCPHFGVCGGCGLQHLRYPAQLDYKRKKVSDALTRIAKLPDTEVAPAVPCSRPLRYRNKLSLPVRAAAGRETQSAEGGTAAEGSIAVGLYKKNSREICPLDDCLLQPKTFGAAARAVAAFMRENRVSAYDEKSGAGTVLRLILRSVGAFAGGVAGGCAEGLAGGGGCGCYF
jgi:23S rRNA (uracil1939-C5)-methyltransferase